MSNRNKRIKPIEANLRKEIEGLEDQVLELNEENSNLGKLLDEQMDYIKQENQELREEIKTLRTGLRLQALHLGEERAMRRKRDREIAGEVIDLQNIIEDAGQTFLGRIIFKGLRK